MYHTWSKVRLFCNVSIIRPWCKNQLGFHLRRHVHVETHVIVMGGGTTWPGDLAILFFSSLLAGNVVHTQLSCSFNPFFSTLVRLSDSKTTHSLSRESGGNSCVCEGDLGRNHPHPSTCTGVGTLWPSRGLHNCCHNGESRYGALGSGGGSSRPYCIDHANNAHVRHKHTHTVVKHRVRRVKWHLALGRDYCRETKPDGLVKGLKKLIIIRNRSWRKRHTVQFWPLKLLIFGLKFRSSPRTALRP